jgi:hypothetical protein
VLRTRRNSPSRNGKRSRANANATDAAENVWPNVARTAMSSVFFRNVPKGRPEPISARQ